MSEHEPEWHTKYKLESHRRDVLAGLDVLTRQQAQMLSGAAMEGVGSGEDAALDMLYGRLGSIDDRLHDVATGLGRLTAIAVAGTREIAGILNTVEFDLSTLMKLTAEPQATAANELFRRGDHALSQASAAGSAGRAMRWYEQGASELRQGLAIYSHNPLPWYNLGIALVRLEKPNEAADAFSQCAFNAARDHKVLSATAVLLAAALYREVGLPASSQELLLDYITELDRCAEVHLALGVHHGNRDQLRQALTIWPYLAADARQAGAPYAEAVAAELCEQPEGPVQRLLRLQQATTAVAEAGASVSLEDIGPLQSPTVLPAFGTEALVLSAAAWSAALETATQLATETTRAVERLRLAPDRIDMTAVKSAARAAQDAEHNLSIARRAMYSAGDNYDRATRRDYNRKEASGRLYWQHREQVETIKRAHALNPTNWDQVETECCRIEAAIARREEAVTEAYENLRKSKLPPGEDVLAVWRGMGFYLGNQPSEYMNRRTQDAKWLLESRQLWASQYLSEKQYLKEGLRRYPKDWRHWFVSAATSAATEARLRENVNRYNAYVQSLNSDTATPEGLHAELDAARSAAEAAMRAYEQYRGTESWRVLMGHARLQEEQRMAETAQKREQALEKAAAEYAAALIVAKAEDNVMAEAAKAKALVDADQQERAAAARYGQLHQKAQMATLALEEARAEVARQQALAAQRAKRVGSAVLGPLAKLQATLAAVRPPEQRIVPFDLPGYIKLEI